jgi:hypothetical protein
MSTIILLLAGAWASAAGLPAPGAQAILDAYANANDKMHGFAAHYYEEYSYSGSLVHASLPSGSYTSFKDGWCFHDFAKQRSLFRRKVWGQQSVGAQLLSKENAGSMQYRWADGVLNQYISGGGVNVIALDPEHTRRFVEDTAMLMTCYFPGAEAMGYFNGDQRRLDKKLAGANLSVRNGMERVGDFQCYVIEGQTRFGRITAWFDPEKGFALTKYIVEAASNDIEMDNLTVANAFKLDGVTKRLEATIEKFAEVNGVWLPVKIDENEYASLPQGDFHKTTRTIQIDSWSVNPDFEALHAFEMNDIPNDSVWQFTDDPATQYRWNGGKLEPVTTGKSG